MKLKFMLQTMPLVMHSIKFIKEFYPTVKIVENAKNGGYAKGYNDALQHIEADIYCLLNSDVEVTENWLTPSFRMFLKRKKIPQLFNQNY